MPRNYSKQRGFTLLEVLIALFIFTIIAIIMTHSLHSLFDTQEHTEKSSERMAALQIATLFLERDLSQAVDRPIMNGSNERESGFVGKSDHFSFTHGGLINPLGELDRSSLQRVSYNKADQHLIRESWQVLDQISTSKADQRQLLDQVSELRFEYLDDKGKYSTSWPPADKSKPSPLPNAVKVYLTLAHWGTITQVYIIPGKAFVTQK